MGINRKAVGLVGAGLGIAGLVAAILALKDPVLDARDRSMTCLRRTNGALRGDEDSFLDLWIYERYGLRAPAKIYKILQDGKKLYLHSIDFIEGGGVLTDGFGVSDECAYEVEYVRHNGEVVKLYLPAVKGKED